MKNIVATMIAITIRYSIGIPFEDPESTNNVPIKPSTSIL